MNVSVLVPWRPDGGHRDRAWQWLRGRWAAHHPTWELVEGDAPPGEWRKATAVLAAAWRSTGQILVVADADVWSPTIAQAVAAVEAGAPWALPHRRVRRLTATATDQVLAGAPLTEQLALDEPPHLGHPAGGILALPASLLADVPPDPRFAGWGHEDDAWAAALTTLAGLPWRGDTDLWHLWHPPQPRQSRSTGSPESEALWQRYARSRRQPGGMRRLVDEGATAWPTVLASS